MSATNGNRDYVVQNARWDADIPAHGTLRVDFTGTMGGDQAPTGTVVITSPTGSGSQHTTPTSTVPVTHSPASTVAAVHTTIGHGLQCTLILIH